MRLVGGLLKAIGDSVLLTRALGHELCNALLFPGVQNGMHRRKAALELFQLDLSVLFSQVIAGPATPYAEPFASGWVPAKFFVFHGLNRIAHQPTNVMKRMLSGPSERGRQQEPPGFFLSYVGGVHCALTSRNVGSSAHQTRVAQSRWATLAQK